MSRKSAPKQTRSGRPGTRPAKGRVAASRTTPGRVHLYAGISLDGYLAAPDGGVDWLDPYADARAGYTPFIKTIGSAIMGRATWDFAAAHGYRGSGDMPCYVVTSRPLDAPSPWVVAWNGDLAGLVRHIRERHPRDIWLMGGGKLTKAFGEADLIDIWSIGFVPVFLGAGLPMFPPGVFGRRRVTLMATREYPSGVIQLRYERATSAKRRL